MPKDSNAKANYLRGLYIPGKVKCIECGRWYMKIGAHVYNSHAMTARQYREKHALPVSKAIMADSLRDKLRDNIKPVSLKALKAGKKYRFTSATVPRYRRSPITTAERIARSKARAKIKDEDMPDILAMRQRGLSLNDIAKKYNCTDGLVSRRLKLLGGRKI